MELDNLVSSHGEEVVSLLSGASIFPGTEIYTELPFTIQVTDGVIFEEQTFSLNLFDINDAPELSLYPLSIEIDDNNHTSYAGEFIFLQPDDVFLFSAAPEDNDPLDATLRWGATDAGSFVF